MSRLCQYLKQQTAAIRKQLNVQEYILKETRAIKRFIKGKVNFPSNDNVSPVIYNDTNIDLKNLDPEKLGAIKIWILVSSAYFYLAICSLTRSWHCSVLKK